MRFVNEVGGVFEITANARKFRDACNNNLVIENEGLVRRSAGSGQVELAGLVCSSVVRVMHNRGVVEVLSGTLALRAQNATAQHTGNFVVAEGATLHFAGNGTQNISGSMGVAGAVLVSGSAVTVEGDLVAPTVTVSGGSLTVTGVGSYGNGTASGGFLGSDGDLTITNLTISSGGISGTNVLTVVSNFVWTGGVMTGSGTTRLEAGSVGVLSGTGEKGLENGRRWENAGTVTWADGDIEARGSGTMRFVNEVGGVFEITANARKFRDACNNNLVIENEGLVRRSAGSGQVELAGLVCSSVVRVMHNRGVVEVLSGTLALRAQNATAQHTGSFEVATNATLTFAGNFPHAFTNTTEFVGLGANRFQAPISLGSDLDLGALTVFFESSASVAGAFTIFNAADGTLTFNKSMTVPGSITVAGVLTVGSSGLTVTISETLTLEATGTINNPGTLQVGAFVDNGGTINGNAPVVIGLPAPVFAITSLGFEGGSGQSADADSSVAFALAPQIVVLKWVADPGTQFVLESSSDLIEWRETPASIEEGSDGHYEGRLFTPQDPSCFFRIRLVLPE